MHLLSWTEIALETAIMSFIAATIALLAGHFIERRNDRRRMRERFMLIRAKRRKHAKVGLNLGSPAHDEEYQALLQQESDAIEWLMLHSAYNPVYEAEADEARRKLSEAKLW